MTAPGGGADRRFMEQALALAALGEGTTSPNPRVGCLLVREGRVVGRGFHRAPGEPHAEAVAAAEAGPAARGSTAYVNLEPCDHQGRTPPCTEVLIRAGVARLVASHLDPHPRVHGRGFDRLRAAGLALTIGTLSEEAERLNEAFLHFHRAGRPLVTLKAALSLDGMIAASGGRARWFSSEPARRFAHRLRLRHDAILVGAGTVRADGPRLTVRLRGLAAPRRRVVLAPTLDLPPTAAMFDGSTPLPRVYAALGAPAARERALAGRAHVVRVGATPDGLDLAAVLADLATLQVQSVLVEGGGRTFAKFLAAGLADRVALFLCGRLVGARGGTPLIDGPSAADPAAGWCVRPTEQLALGPDLVLLGRLEAARGPA
jgi:diaminohydroxyphosphoribosylaminopyrimidine deaminase/5-amino-6-(5-phosphoribosylamino)uracil reductase